MSHFHHIKSIDIQRFKIVFILIFVALASVGQAQHQERKDTVTTVSPFDFGLAEAETDSARYDALYRTHLYAISIGAEVSYQGIGTLTVEITESARPIPLTRHNNFNGLQLIVKNSAKAQYLFTLYDTVWQEITLEPKMVDSSNFHGVEELSNGTYMLVLEDLTPWVANRAGHKYGAMRKDIMLVENGKGSNRPTAFYSTDSTVLFAKFHPADNEMKTITDLSITRDTSSTVKTYCFDINGINNLKISKVNIYTPDTKNMYADAAINIENCTNLQMEDVLIEGTYSRTNNYGYGIQMNNVWNSHFVRLTGHANWGIFGTNNLNNTTLRNCDINRFDIHCYGRDVFFYHCAFHELYNQFSSLFGKLQFEECRFSDFVPVLFEPSYNAYTGFDLLFKNCIFDATYSHNYLVSAGKLDNQRNSRPELAQKCWPNVRIQNMTVNVPANVSRVVLFAPKTAASTNVSHITGITVDGLRFHYPDSTHLANFTICSTPVTSTKTIRYQFKNVILIPDVERMNKQAEQKLKYPGCLAFNLYRSKNDEIVVSDSRLNFNVTENSQYNIQYNNCHIGLIRYSSNSNGTKRNYNRCTLYLNNSDDARYYIDNHANYYKCTFIPCSDKMYISFYGVNNDVIIKNCKTTRKSRLFYQGQKDNIELKGFVIKGSEKYWK